MFWRVSASFTLPVITRLADGTYLSELRGKRKKQRVTVRVIEYSIRDDDGISEVFALITNLLDPDDAPALELARNYSQRWHIELLFRLVKVDLRTPGPSRAGSCDPAAPKGYAKKSGRCYASTKPCEP